MNMKKNELKARLGLSVLKYHVVEYHTGTPGRLCKVIDGGTTGLFKMVSTRNSEITSQTLKKQIWVLSVYRKHSVVDEQVTSVPFPIALYRERACPSRDICAESHHSRHVPRGNVEDTVGNEASVLLRGTFSSIFLLFILVWLVCCFMVF